MLKYFKYNNVEIIETLFDELADKNVLIVELELSNFHFYDFADALQMTGIESMCLKSNIIHGGQFMQLMNRMPNIKTIIMKDSSSISWFHVQSLANSFENLTTLRCKLHSNVDINEQAFLEIVDLVKVRKNEIKLLLIIEKSRENILLVTNDIIEKNTEWLELRFEEDKSARARRYSFIELMRQNRFADFEGDDGW